MSRVIPTINTARVTLRSMRPQDFDRYAEIWENEHVIRHIGGTPRDRGTSWGTFLRNAGHWQMAGFGEWAIEPRGAAQIMGQVGFQHRMRSMGEDFDRWPEAGWVLHPDAQGQGFGREAAQAAHEWFDRVITGPLVCMLDPENLPSLRLARAMGYAPLRDAEFQGEAALLMIRKNPPGSPRNLFEEPQPMV